MESAYHDDKQIENDLHTNTNSNLPENVNYIPMKFNNSDLKKVCEWFPPSFLMKEKVFAIQEVEPALLKLFTRVHETANKHGRKRGGRKVLLLGQEVFGDTFLACGRCGYHSSDNSNVRKHHRRKVCLVDRGYSRSQLRGMDGKERKNFLQQLSSRRYREKCKNLVQQQQQQQQRAFDSSATSQPSQALSSEFHSSVVTTTTYTAAVSCTSSFEPSTTVASQTRTVTKPAFQTTIHLTAAIGEEVISSTSILEDKFSSQDNNVPTNVILSTAHCDTPSAEGPFIKDMDNTELLDSPSDDLLDRCAINSEMEPCALLQNITSSDLDCNGGLPSSTDEIISHPNSRSMLSSGTGVGDNVTGASDVNMKENTVNLTSGTNLVAHESKVPCNLTSFSKSSIDGEHNADGHFALSMSSRSDSNNRILPKIEENWVTLNNEINKPQPPSRLANSSSEVMRMCSSSNAVTIDRKASSFNSHTAEQNLTICSRSNGNEAVGGGLVSYNSVADSVEDETIVLVPNCVSEAIQPSLCIISMGEGERGIDRATAAHNTLPALSSPSCLKFVPLPSSSVQHSKKTFLVPSQISNVASVKTCPQSWKVPLPVLNPNVLPGETQALGFQREYKKSVVKCLASSIQSTKSSSSSSTKISFVNNSGINICRIVYSDIGVGIPLITSKVSEMNPMVQITAACQASSPTTPSLDEHCLTGNVCLKSCPSTDSTGRTTPKKNAKKRKGLTLGPVVAREPVQRLPYDLYTVNEHRQRVAWKPTFCHKAPSATGSLPCRIAFRGARRCRRCLALPLPCLLLYRKLDCRTHHCHFTLFHPHARHQQSLQGKAVRASVGVRIYADTVMSQEFHHYLRSLWSFRLKPSQASRHITNVWAEVLRDRVAEYHADLDRHVASPLLLEEHRLLGAAGDQEHGDQQTTQEHREHYKVCSHEGDEQDGQTNGISLEGKGCEDEILKESVQGAGIGANLPNGSEHGVVMTSYGSNNDEDTASGNLGRKKSRIAARDRECCEGQSKRMILGVSSSDTKCGNHSSVIGCCGDMRGSCTVSRQPKKPLSLNLRGKRYRSITSLSKQTVKTLWRRLEEEESSRPSFDGLRTKRVGGSNRQKDRFHYKLGKNSSLLPPRSQLISMSQQSSTTALRNELRTCWDRADQVGLHQQNIVSSMNVTKTNAVEEGGNHCGNLQSSNQEQQIREQVELSTERNCHDSHQIQHPPQHSVGGYHEQEIVYPDSRSVRVSQCQCPDTVGIIIDTSCVSSNTRDPLARNGVKMHESNIPSSASGCFVSVSPTLHSLSASNAPNIPVMATSSYKCPSNLVLPDASYAQFPALSHNPLSSVPSSSHCAPSVAIGFPQPTTTTYSFSQIASISSSPLASFITQPSLLMRQPLPQPSLMQTSFITRFHPQNDPRQPVMQPTFPITSPRLNQPLHQLSQGSSSPASQQLAPCSGHNSSSDGSFTTSAQLASTSTVLQPVASEGPEPWTATPSYSHHHHHPSSSCTGSESGIIVSQCIAAEGSECCASDGVAVEALGSQPCPSQQQYHFAATAPSYSLQLYPQAPHVAYHQQ